MRCILLGSIQLLLFSYVCCIHTIVLPKGRKNELNIIVREADYFVVSTGRRSILTFPSFIHSSFTSFCRSA